MRRWQRTFHHAGIQCRASHRARRCSICCEVGPVRQRRRTPCRQSFTCGDRLVVPDSRSYGITAGMVKYRRIRCLACGRHRGRARTPAPLRKKAAGDVVDRGRFAHTGGPTRRAVEGASHSIVPAEMSRGPDRAAGGGGIIEDTWRRMHRRGGKAGAVAGDSAYLIDAAAARERIGVIGAIVTATLAVATEQLAAEDQPQGLPHHRRTMRRCQVLRQIGRSIPGSSRTSCRFPQ